ncbi:Required for respiratory growth protein 9 mitochondrial [Coemansia sp. RSA 552]|nr:Required for respiratory growth protein 9 mitochondrial [Coemansia sp. RSA 552]
MTLTPKAQEARAKWGQSKERQTQLRGRLRDASLAGWQRRKIELRLKLGSDAQWAPEKKIATSSMEKIRLLNAEFPKEWTLPRLADQFRISQESIRRILKSRFRPSLAQAERRESRRKEQRSQFQKSVSPGST